MHLSFSLLQVLSWPAYNIWEKVCARDLLLSIDRDLISDSLTFHYESYMSFVKNSGICPFVDCPLQSKGGFSWRKARLPSLPGAAFSFSSLGFG